MTGPHARRTAAERGERRGRRAAWGREIEPVRIRGRQRGERREPVACLERLGDGVLLLGWGTGVGPAPAPDAPGSPRRLGTHPPAPRGSVRPLPTAATAAGALARLGDGELAPAELVTVQFLDRPGGILGRAHLDEAEATRLSGGAIRDHRRRLAGPDLREELGQLLASGGEGQVPHEELLAHRCLLPGRLPVGAVVHSTRRWPLPPPGRVSAPLAQAALLRPQAAPAAAVLAERREVRDLGREVAREVRGAEHGGGAAGSRWWARRAGRRLVVGAVDAQPATAMLETVEAANGVRRHRRIRELGKGKAARAPRHPIHAETDANPRVDLDQQVAQLVLGSLETKIADENGGRNGTPPQDPEFSGTIAAWTPSCEPRTLTRARSRSECCPSVLRRGRCRPHRSGASTPAGGPGTRDGTDRTRPAGASSRIRPCSPWRLRTCSRRSAARGRARANRRARCRRPVAHRSWRRRSRTARRRGRPTRRRRR